MVTSTGYNRIHRLDLGQQLLHLRALGLEGSTGILHNRFLSFHYSARPTALSREYGLHLAYRYGEKPETRILSPDVTELAKDHGRIPHLYEHHHPVKLCLYLPRTREWGAEMSLARTVVPWAIDWLFHFEVWLATGEWIGGGEHPAPREPKSSTRQSKRLGRKR